MNLKKKFVIGAASLALVAGMGVAPAMAADDTIIELPGGTTFQRLAGNDRFETAWEIAKHRYKQDSTLTKAYLVNSTALIDAASAGMVRDGLVLLAPKNADAIKAMGRTIKANFKTVTDVVFIGGEGVLPKSFEEDINALMDGSTVDTVTYNPYDVSRLGGKNRYETNIEVAKDQYKCDNTVVNQIAVVRGDNVVDDLTAGAYGAGPVLILPPTGNVDPQTVKYTKKCIEDPVAGGDVLSLIIGGEGALPTSQVAQLTSKKPTIDPWTYGGTTKDLKEAVMKAAALYLGQYDWQEKIGTQGDPVLTDADMLKAYFGLTASGGTAGTKTSAADAKSYQPSDIDITKKVTDDSKAFKGYVTIYTELQKQAEAIAAQKDAYETDLNTEMGKITGTTNGKDPLVAADLAAINNATVKKAFENLYGKDTFKPIVVEGTSIEKLGVFKLDSATGKVDGLNDAVIADIVAKAEANTTTKVAKTANGTYTLDKAVFVKEVPTEAVASGNPTAGNEKINWVAFQNLVEKQKTEFNKAVTEQKTKLDAAVQAYLDGPNVKVLTQNPGGTPRLQGADRYETSALLAYWLTHKTIDNGGAPQLGGFKEFSIASGDDAHLVDAMVGGQLAGQNKPPAYYGGPILLVPTSGSLPDVTKSALKTLAKDASGKAVQAYVLGGQGAVSKDNMMAASDAYRAGL